MTATICKKCGVEYGKELSPVCAQAKGKHWWKVSASILITAQRSTPWLPFSPKKDETDSPQRQHKTETPQANPRRT
jgi:hypothetical protein